MDKKIIPLSVPNLKGNELKYVSTAVETEWVSTGGPYVNEFEKKVAAYVKAEGAVSCQNGTSGIHTALIVLGVSQEDIVLVPALTFIAAVNPVRYIGAEPVFMDCDHSLCIDPIKLEKFCSEECEFKDNGLIEKRSGKRVKAILVVHVFGNMADMESIMQIAQRYNLKAIEDATEAIGTYYTNGIFQGKYAGTIGDIGVYSFNGNKIITTGGGGMIVSDNQEYLNHAKHLTTQAKSDELYYTHDEIGYNYRLTNLQAALGLAQLEQLEQFIEVKKKNYELYKEELKNNKKVELLSMREGVRSNYWFYALCFSAGLNNERDSLIQYLAERKIQTRPIWGLIHEQKPYQEYRSFQISKAKFYWRQVVNIPCSTNLSCDDVKTVAKEINKFTFEISSI